MVPRFRRPPDRILTLDLPAPRAVYEAATLGERGAVLDRPALWALGREVVDRGSDILLIVVQMAFDCRAAKFPNCNVQMSNF